jgi:NTP pyrophosphatase (non-canonical NTP hydrolase)
MSKELQIGDDVIAYQKWVRKMWTSKEKDLDFRDLYVMSVGLGGETGEVLEILKKAVRDDKLVDKVHLTEELGDVLYYLTMICNYQDISLADVFEGNIKKINIRYAKKKK